MRFFEHTMKRDIGLQNPRFYRIFNNCAVWNSWFNIRFLKMFCNFLPFARVKNIDVVRIARYFAYYFSDS